MFCLFVKNFNISKTREFWTNSRVAGQNKFKVAINEQTRVPSKASKNFPEYVTECLVVQALIDDVRNVETKQALIPYHPNLLEGNL